MLCYNQLMCYVSCRIIMLGNAVHYRYQIRERTNAKMNRAHTHWLKQQARALKCLLGLLFVCYIVCVCVTSICASGGKRGGLGANRKKEEAKPDLVMLYIYTNETRSQVVAPTRYMLGITMLCWSSSSSSMKGKQTWSTCKQAVVRAARVQWRLIISC